MTPRAMVERAGCPLCGDSAAAMFIPFPQIPVVRCDGCGFLYSSRVFPDSQLADYYETDFGGRRHRSGQIVNARVNAVVLERLLDLGSVRTVLDVGSGYGFLLDELIRRHGVRAAGIEMSRQEADFARRMLRLDVRNSSLADSRLEKRAYDLVMTFEVIEHVSHPPQFLAELATYVKPGGHLVVMTDNFESRMAKSLGAGFPKWIPHSHISHFSPATLSKALAATDGLELVRSVSYTPWDVLLRDAYYRMRGIRKTPAQAFDLAATLASEMRGTYRLFNTRRLLNPLWVRTTLSDAMDGDLMYFVCRKKAP